MHIGIGFGDGELLFKLFDADDPTGLTGIAEQAERGGAERGDPLDVGGERDDPPGVVGDGARAVRGGLSGGGTAEEQRGTEKN